MVIRGEGVSWITTDCIEMYMLGFSCYFFRVTPKLAGLINTRNLS